MQTGDFFRKYFKTLREPNAAGEIPVCCPFPHRRDDGTEYQEENPSAHVNLSRGVFHCKVCRAQGRFNDGGMSEIEFYARVNGTTYIEALMMFDILNKAKHHSWEQNVGNLLANEKWMEVVTEQLKLTRDTVRLLQLGYAGDGIQFPVFVHGELLDIRTYDPNGKPKVVGQKGSKPLIFPFDLWQEDDRPTLLCEGEKDCAIARQMGFNAITITGGAGAFPKVLRNYFRDRDVYIVYDCDDAGREGARVVAFHLHDVARSVRIVDLGLEDKEDLHDFFTKYNRSAMDLYQLLQESVAFTIDDYRKEKERLQPLVDLWEADKGKYAGRTLSSRVTLSGRFDAPMEAPAVIEWQCTRYDPDKEVCRSCPFYYRHEKNPHYWILTEDNSHELLELVDSSLKRHQVEKNLRRFVGIPDGCPGHRKVVRARKSVIKAVLSPDVEATIKDDPLASFKNAELVAYIMEQENIDLEDGQRYRIKYRRYPHPLQGQRIVVVVHEVEPSDSPIDTFRMTPEIRERLQVFQGDPYVKMPELAERAKAIIGPHVHPMLVYAVDMVFHSPLRFKFGDRVIKGYPEGAIIGESRTGKTDAAFYLHKWYGVGNYTDCKNASAAGLIGGADKLQNGSGYIIKWGLIPRNHKGLLVLDEFSGIPVDVMARLTSVRSMQVANIQKVGSASGSAPAWTRLLWISNPRVQSDKTSRPLDMYPSGIDVLLELFGSDEDIARFDFFYLIQTPENTVSPLAKAPMEPYDPELYRQLVYWAWSRTAEQIIFDDGVEEMIVQMGELLNAKYPARVKVFGTEAWKKIARLAVAVACRLFSCDDSGERVVVRPEHVKFACRFLVDCYDNDLFRVRQYVESQRLYTETNESVNKVVAMLMRQHPAVIRFLYQNAETQHWHLQAVSGLDKTDFNQMMSKLHEYHLVMVNGNKITPSRRFRKAVEAARKAVQETHLQPLGTGGV